MTGACLTVSQVQSIPWAAAPSSSSVLRLNSAFVTQIVTRHVGPKPRSTWAAAVEDAPVSFLEKETGERLVQNIGRAEWLLQIGKVKELPQWAGLSNRRPSLWRATVRASGRESHLG
jgi:hypothetical protein